MSNLTTHVTRVEILDGTELAANVEILDTHAASVTIKTCVNAHTWRDLSAAILSALESMKLEGDE